MVILFRWIIPTSLLTVPVDGIETDCATITRLPPNARVVGVRERIRLGRDCCVRVGPKDDPVDPRCIGRFVDFHVDLEHVSIICPHRAIRGRTQAATTLTAVECQ